MSDLKLIKGNQGHGGKRSGAGRKPGSVTRKTRETAEKAHAEGITPLEVMLSAMRKAYEEDRLDAAFGYAKDAAPYMHAKLANVQAEVSGKDGGPLQTVTEFVLAPFVAEKTA